MSLSQVKFFQPIIDKSSKVLILGSVPGVQSLQEQRYYANPKNQFWRIVYAIFNTSLDTNYEDRISFIRYKGIALWDVIESCNRYGSLDLNIHFDFPDLEFKKSPSTSPAHTIRFGEKLAEWKAIHLRDVGRS